jgi:site-specific DNA-adenine methylase
MGKPIINYIGNKYRYGKILNGLGLIPKNIDKYVEPFVGGAGFLCYLNETRILKKIIINDKDCMLINFYKHFKNTPEKFKEVHKGITLEVFDKCKNKLTIFKPTLECAIAYFVVKNCSYNSLIAKYKDNSIRSYMSNIQVKYFKKGCKSDSLNEFSEIFKKVKISCLDYRKIIPKNSFVFLDPPYIIKNINNYYIEHNLNLEHIYNYFLVLVKNGNKVLLTLNYDISISKKFSEFKQLVYSKTAKHINTGNLILKELVITNY